MASTTNEPGPDLQANIDAMDRLRAIPATVEAIQGQEKVRRWQAYIEATRAGTVYGRQPLPTPNEHAETIANLRAGAEAARAEWD